ncbi:hypothetical protein H072_9294 [Dactylellina haptotyla CBS 200.50]|uniref:Uncharacterized protein n=1 Tax=Dactylellina haptotyla (strain CBS 200.50) TaxID=1284197 RepID=S8BCZ0_DACHA|nr:hypothetical protein H072_9294 [Dactylellina haptotyla CBS 200.50]
MATVGPAAFSTGKTQLQDAIFSFCSSIPASERSKLPTNPEPNDVLDFVTRANYLGSKRNSRKFGDRIRPFLTAVHQFSGTVDVMVQSNPEIASLVWGSVKFLMTILMAHNKYFEDATSILQRIGRYCPLVEEFRMLLPEPKLEDVICEFYAIIINFCESLVSVLLTKSWKSYVKATLGSLKEDFQDFEKIEKYGSYVDLYIRLASKRAHYRERQADAQFRNRVMDYTSTDIIQSNRSADWRIQQDQRQKEHDHYSMYFRHLGKVQSGTGQWILSLESFTKWENDPSSSPILWCRGIPGAGKSVLTSTVTKYLTSKYPESSAFFFCDFHQKSSLQWETLVRSLIRQLVSSDKNDKILERFENPISQHELRKIFRDIVESTTPCYLILDAIDECDDADKFKVLGLLEELIEITHFKVEHIHPDIESYIERELQERIRIQLLTVTNQMLEETKAALASKAEGMFLYVTFQLDEICTAITEDALRICLEDLPRGLPETYDRILEKISQSRDINTAKKVFGWVAVALTPLSLGELAEATAFNFGDTSYNQGRFPTDDINLILNCGNLLRVEYVDDNDSIHFAHSTVLQHLRKRRAVVDEDANQVAARICVTYLGFSDFERQVAIAPESAHLPEPKNLIPIFATQDNSTTTAAIYNLAKIHKLRNFRDPTLTTKPIDIASVIENLPSSQHSRLKALQRSYQFLNYARLNWLRHCSFTTKGDPTWPLFSKLVLEKILPFPHQPWAQGVPNPDDKDLPHKRAIMWAVLHDYTPILRLIFEVGTSIPDRFREKYLRCDVTTGTIRSERLITRPNSEERDGMFDFNYRTGIRTTVDSRENAISILKRTVLGAALDSSEEVSKIIASIHPGYTFHASFTLQSIRIMTFLSKLVDLKNLEPYQAFKWDGGVIGAAIFRISERIENSRSSTVSCDNPDGETIAEVEIMDFLLKIVDQKRLNQIKYYIPYEVSLNGLDKDKDPNYRGPLEWALDLKLPRISGLLAIHGAIVPISSLPQAVFIDAVAVVEEYAKANKPITSDQREFLLSIRPDENNFHFEKRGEAYVRLRIYISLLRKDPNLYRGLNINRYLYGTAVSG